MRPLFGGSGGRCQTGGGTCQRIDACNEKVLAFLAKEEGPWKYYNSSQRCFARYILQ